MRLLFIISGSIAAKKCKFILEKLTNKNVTVDCIMTNAAKKIINKKLISKSIKGSLFFDSSEKNNKMLHIKLTRKADLVVVCPATANLISKFANGIADDLASTTLMATNKQVVFMPAMNVEMWNNQINKKNVKILQDIGVEFIGPDYGYLSCGEIGLGRLSNEKKILEVILGYLKRTKILKNKKCLITAGPTIEAIDRVRYISNHSSGKQGYEIAKQLFLNGAKVILVSGPTNLQPPPGVKLINVKSAKDMNNTVKKFLNVDIAVFTAAVSDITPTKYINDKIKKGNFKNILIKKNPDIIKNITANKSKKNKFIVGFAAETKNHIQNAKKKLIEKNCDLVVVNKISKKNNVFGSDYNQVSFINKTKIIKFKKMTKIDVAKNLLNVINKNLKK